jgi:predicted RNase H-like HicB family nuclease
MKPRIAQIPFAPIRGIRVTATILLYVRRETGYFNSAMIVPLSKVQLRQDEDGVWIAKSALLPGCHAHGRDRGEATLRFQQAAKAHLEALLETGRSDFWPQKSARAAKG